MTDVLLFTVHTGAIALIATAMVLPPWRGRAARVLAAAGILAAVAAVVTGAAGTRELELFHTFAAFQGAEIKLTAFPVDRAVAPGWAWGACILVFSLGWAAWLRSLPSQGAIGTAVQAFWGPMALVWTGIALGLALQKAAAPAAFASPLPWERVILPPALAACFLLAHHVRRVVLVLAWLSLFVTFARMPVVIFGTLATQAGWGTSLDVHTIELFANPLAQAPVEVVPYSAEQLGWLIWAPNLLVMPGLYMLSLGGIGFAITMFVLHPKPSAPTPPSAT